MADLPENAAVAKLQQITLPEADLAHLELGVDDDFDLEQLVGIELLGADVHKARAREITMATDGDDAAAAAAAADGADNGGDEGDVERRRGDKRRQSDRADDGGFPDAFGAELGQSPEALRAGTPMRTADRVGDIFGGDDGFGGDGGFGDGGFGDVFGDAPAAMGDADVPVLGKTPLHDRRESRLLASTVARELVALSPEAFAVPESAPGTNAAGGALATPGDALGAAAAAALADITPAAGGAAGQQAAKKRKFATRDKTTELTSPMIKQQLANTAPTVAAPAPVPRSKRAMQRAMRAEREPEQLLREAPLRGLCAELAGLYAHNVDVAGQAAADDDMMPLDALGGDLLDVPLGAGAGAAGGDDFDFGGGFDGGGYGDDFGAPGEFGGADGGPSTQQLLDGDDGAAPRADATALPPVTDDYYASDGEGEAVAAAAFESAGAAQGGAVADADAPGATPGKPASWSLHTQRMHTFLARNFDAQPDVTELSFAAMAEGKVRKVVAATFFELLVLKSKSYVELHQDEPYADILVAKGRNFEKK